MNDIEKLLALEELRNLKARYFRCIDTKSFEELRTVFAEDAVFDFREALYDPVAGQREGVEPTPPVEGLDNIVAAIGEALKVAQSAHHGHMPELELTSDTTAKGIWPMEDYVTNGDFAFKGYGHYRETYEKTPDGWRIKTSQITRLKIQVLSD